jgi:hypothetical protein
MQMSRFSIRIGRAERVDIGQNFSMMYLIILLMSHTYVTICGVTQQTSMACTSSQHQSSIALMIKSTHHKKIFMEEGKYLALNKI